MSKRSNYELLKDILEAIEKVFRYTEGMSLEQFENDEKTIDAVVRNFEIIGEAANRVDEEIRKKYPDVEWRRIIGLGNRMVHEYFGIDLQIIWQIKESKLKDFQLEIESILSELSE